MNLFSKVHSMRRTMHDRAFLPWRPSSAVRLVCSGSSSTQSGLTAEEGPVAEMHCCALILKYYVICLIKTPVKFYDVVMCLSNVMLLDTCPHLCCIHMYKKWHDKQ